MQELREEQSNEWMHTVRAQLDRWMAEHWEVVYSFQAFGEGLNLLQDKYKSKYIKPIHPKNGYNILDCADEQEKRVLEFLAPIVNPDKPTWLIVSLSNCIFDTLTGAREIRWGLVIKEIVRKMVVGLGISKPSELTPFSYHLYESLGILSEGEDAIYKAAIVMLEFGIENKKKDEGRIPKPDPEKRKPESEPKSKGPEEGSKSRESVWNLERKGDALGQIIRELTQIRQHIAKEWETI